LRVLLIKTSSLGDVIHTLPALTDAARAVPGIEFDWVVEEGFAEIPSWHPAVNAIIPVAIRRWRKSIWQTWRSGEWKRFKQRLRPGNPWPAAFISKVMPCRAVSMRWSGCANCLPRHWVMKCPRPPAITVCSAAGWLMRQMLLPSCCSCTAPPGPPNTGRSCIGGNWPSA
jgi:hypothetical protein